MLAAVGSNPSTWLGRLGCCHWTQNCHAWVGLRNCFDAEYAGPLTRPRRKHRKLPGTLRGQTILTRGTASGRMCCPRPFQISKGRWAETSRAVAAFSASAKRLRILRQSGSASKPSVAALRSNPAQFFALLGDRSSEQMVTIARHTIPNGLLEHDRESVDAVQDLIVPHTGVAEQQRRR